MCEINSPAKKLRTDALRNRERLLSVAKEAFARDGADTSLENIARQAKVGVGTLYRHFPTRDSLIEAVFRADVDKLAAMAEELAKTLSPLEALRAWMLLFVSYIEAKQIIAPALNSVAGGSEKLYETSGAPISQAISSLVSRAIESGALRKEVEPWGMLWPLLGMSHVHLGSKWLESAKILVDVLIRGSRSEEAAKCG